MLGWANMNNISNVGIKDIQKVDIVLLLKYGESITFEDIFNEKSTLKFIDFKLLWKLEASP